MEDILFNILFFGVVIGGGTAFLVFATVMGIKQYKRDTKKKREEPTVTADETEPVVTTAVATVVDQWCGVRSVGIKMPKTVRDYVVVFQMENGEKISINVCEEMYGGFESGQTGVLTVIDGELYSFEIEGAEVLPDSGSAFCSENALRDFEFHDAELFDCVLSGGCLTANVRFLNIHKDAAQNTFDEDMELDGARITFEGFCLVSYEGDRHWEQDAQGNWYSNESKTVLCGQEALQAFTERLAHEITVLYLGGPQDGVCSMEGIADEPFFSVDFTFDAVKVEWEAYKKAAWYEEHGR